MAKESKTIRVALADDHTMFRKGVVSILNSADDIDVVAEAASGTALLEASEALPALPDVCLLDVNMPGLNGYETLVRIKKQYPGIRVLILTMIDHESIILQTLRAGANGYLLKEYEPEVLVEAVRHVMEEDFYHSELVSSKIVGWVRKGNEPYELRLSKAEQEFFRLCTTDLTYKEMAAELGVSIRTVEGYRDSLFARLGIKSRTGLAVYAIRMGLVSI